MVAIRANDRIPGANCEHSVKVWGKEVCFPSYG